MKKADIDHIKDRAAKRWHKQPKSGKAPCDLLPHGFYSEAFGLHEAAFVAGFNAGRKAKV
jgi:hypothetical protein